MLKYKIYVLFLFIVFICTYNFIKVDAIKHDLYLPLLGRVIYIDPGHGR